MDTSASPHTPASSVPQDAHRSRLGALMLGAIGIVYGDIGTSPLYTIKEAFAPHYGLSVDPASVFGILSLIFWSLVVVITIKYVVVIMRADNDGEGGIMALTALVARGLAPGSRGAYVVGLLGVFGVALFFGDGVLTPAISVLSAVEGLGVAAPGLAHWVLPIAIAVLIVLFLLQRFGTEVVGRAFGPVVLAWFAALAAIGAHNIVAHPEVLQALDPRWGARFFAAHGWHGLT
ncbi:MAG: KUP/HAK/KT family potassium transporter, partial [Luteimonas sp.]